MYLNIPHCDLNNPLDNQQLYFSTTITSRSMKKAKCKSRMGGPLAYNILLILSNRDQSSFTSHIDRISFTTSNCLDTRYILTIDPMFFSSQ